MKISQALLWAKKEFLKADIQNQRISLESEILLAHVLKVTREWLHTWSSKEIDEMHLKEFELLIKKRLNHIPVAYLTSEASFYSRSFYVDERVLIPRPETELLIELVSSIIEKKQVQKIAEIGTGSGIIPITLALKYPHIKIVATDISQAALEVAQINLTRFHTPQNYLSDRIDLICTHLLDQVDQNFDLLISNPPYIAKNYPLESDVLYEPKNALFGGEKGDEILKEIIELASERNIRLIACEMGYDQKLSMQQHLKEYGYQGDFYQDYNQIDRGFIAIKI